MSLKMVQSVVTRKGLWQLSTDVVGNRVKYSEFNEGRKVLESSDIEKLALKLIFLRLQLLGIPTAGLKSSYVQPASSQTGRESGDDCS